jgi:glutathione S-transferase
MYAPVVTRFATYGIELAGAEREYSNAVHALPSLQEWTKAGQAEARVITASERGTPVA